MSRHEYRRRASLGKCHRGGRCRWVRGVPADRPASVASLSALLAVSRPQTSQATPLTREQRLRCVLCHLTCLHPKHHVAHPFVWHDVRSGVVFDRGCHQCEYVSMPLVSLVHRHNPGAEVPPTPPLSYFAAIDLQVNRAAARDLYPVPACGCGGSFSPSAGPRDAPPAPARNRPARRGRLRSASGRCADYCIIFFLSTRPTEHSMHLRSRTDAGLGALSAASGTRARTLQFSEQAIRSTQRCGARHHTRSCGLSHR